jgi:16S rRNA processing protein RimM
MEGRKYVAVGEIAGPHGLNGQVAVRPLSDRPGRGKTLRRVVLVRGAEEKPATVSRVFPTEGRWLVSFEGIRTREDAEALRGWTMAVPEEESPALPEGTFWVHDLVGREVETEDGTDLGTITSIFHTGANDVFVIEGGQGELFFPALKELVLEVPAGGGKVRVRVPPGLLEACRSGK